MRNQRNGQRITIIPSCYINHGGEAFKKEHMIIKDDDGGQVDKRPALESLERAEE